jgi:hypothetical protein
VEKVRLHVDLAVKTVKVEAVAQAGLLEWGKLYQRVVKEPKAT